MYCKGKYFIWRYLFKFIKKGISNIVRVYINKVRNEEVGGIIFERVGGIQSLRSELVLRSIVFVSYQSIKSLYIMRDVLLFSFLRVKQEVLGR